MKLPSMANQGMTIPPTSPPRSQDSPVATAGSSLLVTRFGVNSVKEVDAALTRFAQNNVEIKGAILNCMERRASNEYGYYAYEYGKSND